MSKKTNLVYLINSLNTGGAQIGMSRLLFGLNEIDYNITLIVLDSRERRPLVDVPSYVEVIKLYNKSNSRPLSLINAAQSIRSADIIVGSMYHSSIISRLFYLANKKATVVTWQHNSVFKNKFRELLYCKTAFVIDAVLADSQPVKDMLTKNSSMCSKKIKIVPISGISINDYNQVKHEDKDVISIGTVGTLTKQKNYSMVLDVADRMQSMNVEFNIAGDGKLYDKIQSKLIERDLSNVQLHGFVDDVSVFLSEMDIYFQPSHYEGLCITVLEAMASGLPVVGSDVDGIGRNVEHDHTGLLYSPSDADGFEDAIYKLANNVDLRKQYGKNAREMIVENFTQEALVADFKDAIEN